MQDGRWSRPKGHPVWRALLSNMTIWVAHSTSQGYLQERPEGMQYQPSTARGSRKWHQIKLAGGQGSAPCLQRKGERSSGWKENPQATEASDWSCRIYHHSCCLMCSKCQRSCRSHIGLYNHNRYPQFTWPGAEHHCLSRQKAAINGYW